MKNQSRVIMIEKHYIVCCLFTDKLPNLTMGEYNVTSYSIQLRRFRNALARDSC